jgi:hypothetical protein
MIERERAIIDALERAEIAVGATDDRDTEHISHALYCVATADAPADPKLAEAVSHLRAFLWEHDPDDLAAPVEDALGELQNVRSPGATV